MTELERPSGTEARADPRPATVAMAVAYAAGALGVGLGFNALDDGPAAAIGPVALFAVGILGVLSFVRHAVLQRSDAARMKWESGRTNYFQIEVGLANLAWGLVAIAAVWGGWGVRAQGAVTTVFGLYLLLAAGLHLGILTVGPASAKRGVVPVLASALMGAAVTYFGVAAALVSGSPA